MTLTITHTYDDGTVVDGLTRDDKAAHSTLKAAGFRFSRNVGWYVRGSRQKRADGARITRARDELVAAGYGVDVEIDDAMPDASQRIADRETRSLERAGALASKADKLDGQATATLDRAREMADVIPMGQPILTDHYSARRHRNHLDKVNRTYGRGVAQLDEARDTERRAAAAKGSAAQLSDPGFVQRRIDEAAADVRRWDRTLEGALVYEGGKMRLRKPDAERRAQVEQLRADAVDELAAWRLRLAALEAEGVKVWGPDDFVKGDRVNDSATVVRVNKKTLTVQHDVFPGGMTNSLPYNKVRSKA